MRVILTGGSGMLGIDCKVILERDHEVVSPDKIKMDITSWDRCTEVLHRLDADVVLNCAGFNDVAECEQENLMISKINVEGPRNLAQCSARYGYRMVHVSCHSVFDGTKVIPQPYFEDDATNPVSGYGRLKRDSEVAVRENAPYHAIIRTGWLYGKTGNNIVYSFIRHTIHNKDQYLKVPSDQVGSPTWTLRLANQIAEIIRIDGRGTYNASAEGYCSMFDFAAHVLKRLELNAKLLPVSGSSELVKMPVNTILENRFLKKQGIHIMENWAKDLDTFLDTHGEGLIRRAEAETR